MRRSFFRSLSVKLTLAFLVVGLMALLSVSLIVARQTRRDFDTFVRDRAASHLADQLIGFYAINGDWTGVEHVVREPGEGNGSGAGNGSGGAGNGSGGAGNGNGGGGNGSGRGEGNGPGGSGLWSLSPGSARATAIAEATQTTGSSAASPATFELSPEGLEVMTDSNAPLGQVAMAVSMRVPFTIVGQNGRVVFSATLEKGAVVDDEQIEHGIPLLVNETRVGTLLFAAGPPEPLALDTNESSFIRQMWQTLAWGSLGALMVALIMGAIIAQTLTRPLRVLTEATQDVARGNLGRQVNVQSRDEVGDLAHAFNHMSSDLENSVNLRRRMTADIAHDLRTPLSVILGYTEALDDGILPPSAETYAILHDEAKHLSRLVDDLRTLSLAEAGELRIYPQQVPPEEVLNRVTAAHKVQADQRGVALATQIAPGTPVITVDPERLAQVLHNLVSNALRYTPSGGSITLSAARSTDSSGVDIRVQDTGQGIAPEHINKVFERFYRGDAARQQTGESGLGLPIAKSLIEMHGGTITVASELGKGTAFTIHLPQSAVASATIA